MFLRPSGESANLVTKNVPIIHPMKCADAGKPLMIEFEHWRPHSDMIELEEVLSQDQSDEDGKRQGSQDVAFRQCQVGSASV